VLSEKDIKGIGMTSQRTRERLVQRLREKGIANEQVLDVISQTPRHLFVDEAIASRAYEDTALPIGHGQTISQPYIVARMTELLLSDKVPARVLEVGTGCGYQSAILSQLVDKVYTVERIKALMLQARSRFRQLRLRNIQARHTDGGWGWEQYACYDGIIVTAAPEKIPQSLLEQLEIGGKLVIPVGRQGGAQILSVIVRTEAGYEREDFEAVSFVPLLGGVG
jgi:protein-L-isoaspartate(D-aspartate) O-methyltransferase